MYENFNVLLKPNQKQAAMQLPHIRWCASVRANVRACARVNVRAYVSHARAYVRASERAYLCSGACRVRALVCVFGCVCWRVCLGVCLCVCVCVWTRRSLVRTALSFRRRYLNISSYSYVFYISINLHVFIVWTRFQKKNVYIGGRTWVYVAEIERAQKWVDPRRGLINRFPLQRVTWIYTVCCTFPATSGPSKTSNKTVYSTSWMD